LEGLEISEVMLSDVLKDNENKRIDSEYFKKQFLKYFDNVPNLRPLGDFVEDGYRVVYESTEVIDEQIAKENNYPLFLQATDVNTPFIDTSNLHYVSEADWFRYPKGRIKKGEILIEVKGKIEKVAIVPDDFPEKTLVSGSLYKMTVNEKISKYVLLCYFISKYGVAFKDRYKTNLLISFISKPDLYRIPIPNFSLEFQNKIDEMFFRVLDYQGQSKTLYAEAEEMLLDELGLKDWQPKNENVSVKSFFAFQQSGRLDAEYYQPKYDELFDKIIQRKNKSLGKIATIKKSIEPGSEAYQDSGIPFYRVANLSKFGLSDTDIYLDKSQYYTPTLQPKEDTILLSKDGSVGIAYKVEQDMEAITSGAILHLTIKDKDFLPDYLTLVLNSVVVKMQSERDAGGSIIQHWKPSEIEQVIIPQVSMPIQQQIAAKIQQSFALKAESKRLLEEAKAMVEREIEK
jgi:hypothetical protein